MAKGVSFPSWVFPVFASAVVVVIVYKAGVFSKFLPSRERVEPVIQTDFDQAGNIAGECNLVYEIPDNPAVAPTLIFTKDSMCDDGSGESSCLLLDGITCGQRARVTGNVEEKADGLPTRVSVLTLTMLGENSDAAICCVPGGEDVEHEEDLGDGFELYRNPKFNYEIIWHTDWHKQGDNEPPYPPPPFSMTFSRRFSDNPPELCDFSILAFEEDNAYEGEIDSMKSDDTRSYSSVPFAGTTAEVFEIDNDTQTVTTLYFGHNNHSFRMGYNVFKGTQSEEACVPVFDQMIDSFRFLD